MKLELIYHTGRIEVIEQDHFIILSNGISSSEGVSICYYDNEGYWVREGPKLPSKGMIIELIKVYA